jgi:hypothetical protein
MDFQWGALDSSKQLRSADQQDGFDWSSWNDAPVADEQAFKLPGQDQTPSPLSNEQPKAQQDDFGGFDFSKINLGTQSTTSSKQDNSYDFAGLLAPGEPGRRDESERFTTPLAQPAWQQPTQPNSQLGELARFNLNTTDLDQIEGRFIQRAPSEANDPPPLLNFELPPPPAQEAPAQPAPAPEQALVPAPVQTAPPAPAPTQEQAPAQPAPTGPDPAVIEAERARAAAEAAARAAEEQRQRDLAAAEDARIQAFRNNLLARFSDASGRLSGLDIDAIDRVNAIDSELDGLAAEGRSFSAARPFDLTDVLSLYDPAKARVGDIRGRYNSEVDRINAARNEFLATARGTRDFADAATIYDLDYLRNAQTRAADARAKIGGFTSKLGYDFSPALTDIAAAEQRVSGRLGERNAELDRRKGIASKYLEGLNGLDLWRETDIRNIGQQAISGLADLDAFKGDDLQDERDAFSSVYGRAGQRLGELGAKRTSIEDGLKAYLEQARNAGYYSDEDVLSRERATMDMDHEANLYGAQNAYDEVADLYGIFDSQRGRLAGERANRQVISERERAEVLKMLDSNRRAQRIATLRDDSRLPISYRSGRDDRTGVAPSAFARAVGV